jgi:hypothetical protein
MADQEFDELLVVPAAIHVQIEQCVTLVGQNSPEREAMLFDPTPVCHVDRNAAVLDVADDMGAEVAPEQGERPPVRARQDGREHPRQQLLERERVAPVVVADGSPLLTGVRAAT